jgi:ribosome-associated protein
MEKVKVFITTPFIKLDALLKYSGVVGTGGEAKVFIEEGLVLVNGVICQIRGKKIYPGEKVKIKGQLEIAVEEEKR